MAPLYVCADGSYVKELQQGCHDWVFSTPHHRILWKGASPAISHPMVMLPYHVEFSGLTSVPFTLLWICTTQGIDSSSVRIFCDNESALHRVFATIQVSNNPLGQLSLDIDLITCARDVLLQLPVDVKVAKEWVKGHYTGNQRKIQHDLNDLADKLAVEHNSSS